MSALIAHAKTLRALSAGFMQAKAISDEAGDKTGGAIFAGMALAHEHAAGLLLDQATAEASGADQRKT